MQVNIERAGLDTAVRGVWGCVVAPLFEDVGKAYVSLDGEDIVDYSALLKIAEKEADYTPFHMLLEFASYGQDNLDEFTITHNDVIRLFSTKYHFDFVSNNLINPMVVSDTASFLVNHMMLPMQLSQQDGVLQGEYTLDGHTMRVFPLITPPGLEIESDAIYGVHMCSVLTPLTEAQVTMIETQLALSNEFATLAKHVAEVDFTQYQHFGNFNQKISDRHQKIFG
jgi:hypothetical protein